ncbi:MAG: oligosaccharide flippase family protein [Proteobacteria bacterium]|nr:oligosaccharide flippase family protein [Pseudomonadota bacterium]
MTPVSKYFQLVQGFLKKNSDLSEIYRGGGITLVLRLLSGLMSFLSTLAVARIAGADSAGLFFLAMSIVGLFSVLSPLGTDSVLSRHISTAVEAGDGLVVRLVYRRVLGIVFTSVICIAVIVAIGAPWIAGTLFSKPDLAPLLALMALSVIPYSLTWMHGSAFLGFSMMVTFNLLRRVGVGALFLTLLGLIYLANPKPDILLVGYGYVLAGVFMLMIALWLWVKRPALPEPAVENTERYSTRAIMKSSFPLLGSGLLGAASGRIGQILVGAYQAAAEVAIYSVSQQIAGLSSVLLTAINSAAFPRIARLYYRGDIAGIQRVSVWMTRLVVVTCVPIVVLLMIMSDWVLSLFGPEFDGGATILLILLLGQLINIVTGIVGTTLNACGYGRLLFQGHIAGFLATLILCFLLIPRFGTTGAAIANATGSIIINLNHTYWVKRKLGFFAANIFVRV